MSTLTRALQDVRRLHGSKRALLDDTGELDWAGWASRVARLATLLQGRGVQRGRRFAVLSLNSPRFAELLQAGWHLGASAVPLNHRLAPPELADILLQANCRALVVDPALAALMQTPALAPWAEHALWLSPETLEPALETALAAPVADTQPADEALLLFTGGTSGRAKGVPLSHAQILANARQVATVLQPSPQHVVLHVAPMFHSAELVFTCFLLQGAAQAYLPRFTPAALLQAVQQHRVTTVLLVPTMLAMLLDSGLMAQHDLSSLRQVIYGASPVPRVVIEQAVQALPGVQFIQGYGLTETGPLLTMLDFPAHQAALAGLHPERLASCGRALPGVRLQVRAGDGSVQPAGQAGEIVAQGDNIFCGYLDAPELSRQALVQGWFHTGDIGLIDGDGYVFILDRLKDVIITGGENVYSAEVEAVLMRHPGVLEVAVVGRPHPVFGEAVHAVVVPKPGHHCHTQALQDFCRAHIGGYKVPRSVSLANQLPRTAMGKVLKVQLRQALAEEPVLVS